MMKPFKSIRVATCLAVALALVGWNGLSGQDSNHSFLSFGQGVTPEQLNQRLANSAQVKNKLLSDRLSRMVLDKFSSLDGDQKKRLMELAQDFPQQKNRFSFQDRKRAFEKAIQEDPDLKKSFEDLRSRMEKESPGFSESGWPPGATGEGLQSEFQNRIRRELQNALERNTGGGSGGPIRQTDRKDEGDSAGPGNALERFLSSDLLKPGNFSGGGSGGSGRPEDGPPGREDRQPGFPGRNSFDPVKGAGRPEVPASGNAKDLADWFDNGAPEPSPDSSDGFSDDGTGSSWLDWQNRISSGREFSPASANGENDSLPDESIGHRFNRLVMNSMERAMEKQVGDDGSGSRSSFESLFGKFLEKMSNTREGEISPGDRSGIFSRWGESVQKAVGKSRGPRRRRGFGFRGFGNGPSLPSTGGGISFPAFSPASIAVFLLVAAGLVAGIILLLRKPSIKKLLGKKSKSSKKTAPDIPEDLRDQDQVVTLIDRFTLWLFGQRADWWNSKIMQKEFSESTPEFSGDIDEVIRIYDRARYSPGGEAVSPRAVMEVKTTLGKLKEKASLQESSTGESNS